jgi:hypothetical protein
VREESPQLGDLRRDFDFNQPPAPPLLLPTNPQPWSLPAAFRLLVAETPLRQTPRFHQNGLVVVVSCLTRCHLKISGHLTIGPSGRKVDVIPRTLTFAGTRRLHVALPRSARTRLKGTLAANRTVHAHLQIAATPLAQPQQPVSASLLIKLRR